MTELALEPAKPMRTALRVSHSPTLLLEYDIHPAVLTGVGSFSVEHVPGLLQHRPVHSRKLDTLPQTAAISYFGGCALSAKERSVGEFNENDNFRSPILS